MEYTPSHRLALERDDEDDRDLSGFRAAEVLGWPDFLPKQWEFFAFEGDPLLSVEAFLGGWGCGKTSGAARKFFSLVLSNPWDVRYLDDRPKSAIIAPTMRILAQATVPALDALVPRSMVLRRRGPPENDIHWANGHRTLLVSAASELEGVNLTHLWADEIHHAAYDHHLFLNYQARVRDPFRRRGAVLVTGLPESTWVREVFDVPRSASRNTILSATADNPAISTALLEEFYRSCPSGDERRLLGGEWMPPVGAIYPQFDPHIHVIDRAGDPNQPVHLSLDVGNQGALLVWQEIDVEVRPILGRSKRETGLLCVDELLPEDASVDEMCLRFKLETPWRLDKGVSKICTDPKTDRDEAIALRRHFPGCTLVQRDRADELYYVATGTRLMGRALKDALGNVRLYFSRNVSRGRPGQRNDRGILSGIPRYRTNRKTGLPIRDNKHDHALDAARYAVCELLPVERAPARTL